MKSTGMIRRVDELGRVVIPKEIRNKLDISERDPIEIFIDGNSVVLKKFESGCVFCNSSRDLTVYKEKFICKKCLTKINSLDETEEYIDNDKTETK